MENIKARMNELEKLIKARKILYKIYWAAGTYVGEFWLKLFN